MAEASGSPLAREVLARIAALYAVEERVRGRRPDERLALRAAYLAPVLSDLRSRLEGTLARVPGRGELEGAIRYALSRWDALTLVLHDGRACLDNSAAERAMRPIALGRNNWTFAGSDRGGERAAAAYTLMETAKLNGLDPEAWLRHVLARIADHPARRVAELLPWRVEGLTARLDPRRLSHQGGPARTLTVLGAAVAPQRSERLPQRA